MLIVFHLILLVYHTPLTSRSQPESSYPILLITQCMSD